MPEDEEWAEVVFDPSKGSTKKDAVPDRYLAIRVRPSQGELFADGNAYHYYAVVTNNWTWDGERLLRWHRKKCGTVEKVFDVLKNDLAGGVLPCGRFYANAAWWRLELYRLQRDLGDETESTSPGLVHLPDEGAAVLPHWRCGENHQNR